MFDKNFNIEGTATSLGYLFPYISIVVLSILIFLFGHRYNKHFLYDRKDALFVIYFMSVFLFVGIAIALFTFMEYGKIDPIVLSMIGLPILFISLALSVLFKPFDAY